MLRVFVCIIIGLTFQTTGLADLVLEGPRPQLGEQNAPESCEPNRSPLQVRSEHKTGHWQPPNIHILNETSANPRLVSFRENPVTGRGELVFTNLDGTFSLHNVFSDPVIHRMGRHLSVESPNPKHRIHLAQYDDTVLVFDHDQTIVAQFKAPPAKAGESPGTHVSVIQNGSKDPIIQITVDDQKNRSTPYRIPVSEVLKTKKANTKFILSEESVKKNKEISIQVLSPVSGTHAREVTEYPEGALIKGHDFENQYVIYQAYNPDGSIRFKIPVPNQGYAAPVRHEIIPSQGKDAPSVLMTTSYFTRTSKTTSLELFPSDGDPWIRTRTSKYYDNEIRFYNLDTGKEYPPIPIDSQFTSGPVALPDGRIAYVSDKHLYVYMPTGKNREEGWKQVQKLELPRDPISDSSNSPIEPIRIERIPNPPPGHPGYRIAISLRAPHSNTPETVVFHPLNHPFGPLSGPTSLGTPLPDSQTRNQEHPICKKLTPVHGPIPVPAGSVPGVVYGCGTKVLHVDPNGNVTHQHDLDGDIESLKVLQTGAVVAVTQNYASYHTDWRLPEHRSKIRQSKTVVLSLAKNATQNEECTAPIPQVQDALERIKDAQPKTMTLPNSAPEAKPGR